MENSEWSSLSTLTLIVAGLFLSFIVWLILSTCLGVPIGRIFSGFWNTTATGESVYGIQGAMAWRRRELGGLDGEDWEMEARRRPAL